MPGADWQPVRQAISALIVVATTVLLVLSIAAMPVLGAVEHNYDRTVRAVGTSATATFADGASLTRATVADDGRSSAVAKRAADASRPSLASSVDPLAPQAADSFVDLASAARRSHILEGKVLPGGRYSGGHRAGTGFPTKSEFPASWSDDQIMHHIADIATDPTLKWRPGRGGDFWGQRNTRRDRHRRPDPQQLDLDGLPDERWTESWMTEQEDFVGRVRGLVISLLGILSHDESDEVERLIDHGELGEALRALAWIIVEEGKRVPSEAIDAIEELSEGLVVKEHMPSTLREHVLKR